jgi:hypothetical protein
MEPRLDLKLVEQSGNLFTAAMHKDQLKPRSFQIADLRDQLLPEGRVNQYAATEFNYSSH